MALARRGLRLLRPIRAAVWWEVGGVGLTLGGGVGGQGACTVRPAPWAAALLPAEPAAALGWQSPGVGTCPRGRMASPATNPRGLRKLCDSCLTETRSQPRAVGSCPQGLCEAPERPQGSLWEPRVTAGTGGAGPRPSSWGVHSSGEDRWAGGAQGAPGAGPLGQGTGWRLACLVPSATRANACWSSADRHHLAQK